MQSLKADYVVTYLSTMMYYYFCQEVLRSVVFVGWLDRSYVGVFVSVSVRYFASNNRLQCQVGDRRKCGRRVALRRLFHFTTVVVKLRIHIDC